MKQIVVSHCFGWAKNPELHHDTIGECIGSVSTNLGKNSNTVTKTRVE